MAQIERTSTGDREIIAVTGELGIQDAVTLTRELRAACDGRREVLIDLRQATTFDLTCLQALCAAHRTYGCLPEKGCMHAALSKEVQSVLADIGLEPQLCGADISKVCLWKGSEDGQRDSQCG